MLKKEFQWYQFTQATPMSKGKIGPFIQGLPQEKDFDALDTFSKIRIYLIIREDEKEIAHRFYGDYSDWQKFKKEQVNFK